ncbi:MAG TPA: SMC family ATPase [Pseudonocardiaceae bacterium]|jgi:exonuclease SbcC
MRLHHLQVRAFGPYPRAESVDFDALGADGLFLLHGDTGAGKTTLLDAVAFALFGTVPGARGETKRLRCDYAEPDVATEVRLEFTVQGHRLLIVRGPEYERPKRDGSGTTTQRAKASLTWVGTAPSGHAPDGLARIDEVNRTVVRLLGMSAEQFFQVVLLPQGDFARFLRAETAERERLLERLFGTERFADVERWFRTARTERGRAVEEIRQDVRELLARVGQAAGVEPDDDAPADIDWLATLHARLRGDAVDAEKEDRLAREDRVRAEQELAYRRDLAERIRRVTTALATLAELDNTAAARRAIADELSAAHRCQPVLLAATAARRAEADLAAAAQAERLAIAALAGRAETDGDVPTLRAMAGAMREEAGGLRQLVAEAETQRVDQLRLTELTARHRHTEARVADLTEQLTNLPRRLVAAHAERDAAMSARNRLDGLRAHTAELRALHADATRLPALQAADLARRDEATQAVDAHQQAREALLDARQRRLDGMAAELAGALTPDHPCPVCGSPEHPAPAASPTAMASETDESTAAEAEQEANTERERTSLAAAETQHRLNALVERLAGRTEPELAADLGVAEADLATATTRAATVEASTELVARLERDAADLRAEQVEAERNQAVIATERAQLAEAIQDRALRLDAARADFPDVAARREHLLTVIEALDELAKARSAREQAEQRVEQAQADVRAAALNADFADEVEALAAARAPDVLDDLQRRLVAADRQEAAARAVLAEPELVGIRIDTDVDLAGAQAQVEAARERTDVANAALQEAQRKVDEVTDLAARLTDAWQRLAPAQARQTELAALTDVVNGRGQNAHQMSLRSYVLAARLTEVADSASRRLRRMSQGRFSFVRSSAGGPRNTRGGLGLDVLDDYSGRVRPAKTLSGGESFLASLALALGLADVVAAETGGALLDTLFIDEGFGTLDADTLDQVLDTLDELRAGGRVVGLVSHVEELRQRIPVQLRVRRARTGSTARVHGTRSA